jgi:hypothetical protein
MTSMLATLALANLLAGWHIEGPAAPACPEPEAVEAALVAMRGPAAAPGSVELEAVGASALRISIRGGDGALIARRELDVSPNCDRRAQAVAVVIVAHEAELRAAEDLTSERLSVPDRGVSIGWSAGALALVAPGDAAFGGVVEATGGTPAFGVVARLGVASPRTIEIGPGSASWSRPFASIGARERVLSWRGGRWRLDVREDLMALLALASGTGFASNASARSLTAGVGAGVRIARTMGPESFVAWLEVGGFAAVGARQRLLEREPAASANEVALPRAEALLSLGGGWQR